MLATNKNIVMCWWRSKTACYYNWTIGGWSLKIEINATMIKQLKTCHIVEGMSWSGLR